VGQQLAIGLERRHPVREHLDQLGDLGIGVFDRFHELEQLLRARGHAVARCERDSAGAARARAARAPAPQLGDEQAVAAADLLKALADPARLQILDILGQRAGAVCVCDFEGVVGLPDKRTGQRPRQPTISHHLKVLRDAGLVGYEKRGLWAYYFVHRERLAEAQSLLANLLRP